MANKIAQSISRSICGTNYEGTFLSRPTQIAVVVAVVSASVIVFGALGFIPSVLVLFAVPICLIAITISAIGIGNRINLK